MHKISKYIKITALFATTLLSTTACSALTGETGTAESETINFGVSAPLTGTSAEYGEYWKQGFEIALSEINNNGGVDGKKVKLVWEDSQSDPKQSVPIAQKFVSDPSIIAELGDFSSPASMAASATYQEAGVVQFGFTNSTAEFTEGGDRMWSTCLTQTYFQGKNAELVKKYADSVSVVYIQSDWGKSAFDDFAATAKKIGLEIKYVSAIQPDSEDYRSVLIKARDANPDAIVHIGYAPEGAKVIRQLRELGWTKKFFGGQATPEFISASGKAANGTIINENLIIGNDSPAVLDFNQKFKEKYSSEPSQFSVWAYDALNVLVQAAKYGGATREGIFEGLNSGKEFDSIQFGKFTFGKDRRPEAVDTVPLIVENNTYKKLAEQ